ncbi:hypothetical protein ACMD2_16788, partial [Ananas comosus]
MEVVALSTATWSLPPPPPPPQPLTSPSPPLSSLLFKSSPLKKQQPYLHISFKKERRYVLTPLRCSLGESPSTASSSSSSSSSASASERWLLEPAGDGDSRHIGYRVPLPDAFEVASDTVTVGRLPENADVAIPVATVSRIHARLEKKKGNLFVTDLDSTNGTYIGYEKLKPGAATNVISTWLCFAFRRSELMLLLQKQESTGRATATSGLAKQRPPGGVLQGGVGTSDRERRGEGGGAREAGGKVERGVAAGDVTPVEGGGHARRPALRSGGVGRRCDLQRLLLLRN